MNGRLKDEWEAETEATLADLQASEEDFAAGQWVFLEELTALLQAKQLQVEANDKQRQ